MTIYPDEIRLALWKIAHDNFWMDETQLSKRMHSLNPWLKSQPTQFDAWVTAIPEVINDYNSPKREDYDRWGKSLVDYQAFMSHPMTQFWMDLCERLWPEEHNG